ncbi:MAG: PAS domain-containing protein [Methylococcales bacterium]|nr:PAS domain-containing protein [Methylococcales bacterium]
MQDGISVLNPDLSIRHVNGIMNKWYKENLPLEGKKCYEVYHNADKPCDPCPTLRCLKSNKKEWNIVPGLPGSSVEWIELFSYPIKDPNSDKITGVIEFVRDITENKKAEQSLKKQNEEYAALNEELTASEEEIRVINEELIIAKEKAEENAQASEVAAREARLAQSLAELEAESDEGVSTVARYVKQQAVLSQDKPAVTGVAKYLASKIVEASKKPAASGVEKYLANQSMAAKSVPVLSGVEKYLKKQAIVEKSAPVLSGVAQYMSKKAAADMHKPAVSGVAKYIASVRSAVDAAATIVEKCLEGEFIPAGQESGESSVDRYLEEKENLDKESRPTGVDKYLNDRVVLVKEVHVPTRVEMYLDDQAAIARETALTGVEKYLVDQVETVEQVSEEISINEGVEEGLVEENVAISSVERYLQTKPEPITEPVQLSGVEKYMEKQAVLAKEEAIANATGVERYLMTAAS